MKVEIPSGDYVLAISGGIDSMVLLDLLAQQAKHNLIVAHFDHGIRWDSGADAEFVAGSAERYGLPVVLGKGNLGMNTSEAEARRARYDFLASVKYQHNAQAIITAHHQDDLIETAIINLMRGTGPQGIYSMLDNSEILRPLLKYPKSEIENYAKANCLTWRDDPSNHDDRYLRNRVRQTAMSNLGPADRQKILDLIYSLRATHAETKRLIAELRDQVLVNQTTLSREAFIKLPPEVSHAFVHDWLGELRVEDLDRPTIERLALAIKTGGAHTTQDIKKGSKLELTKTTAQFRNTLQ